MVFKFLNFNIIIGLIVAFIIFNLLRFSLASIEKSQETIDNKISYSSFLFKLFFFHYWQYLLAFHLHPWFKEIIALI